MPQKHKHFIVIDDDPINNLLCSKNIKKNIQEAEVITFTEAEKGLDHIKSFFNEPNVENAVLFLDINMPIMSGWEFMEEFEKLNTLIKDQIFIYILSSSIDQQDKLKAKNHPDVVDYIEKPLSPEILKNTVVRLIV
nr:response regulator [uncultured Flavobacterium sp.]